MASRGRDSGVLGGVAFGALIAVLLLGFLVFKTLSFDRSLHQQRLAALRTIDDFDGELNRVFVRILSTGLELGLEEKQGPRLDMARALNALQEGNVSLAGLSPALDAAMDTYYDTAGTKIRIATDVTADQKERLKTLIELPTAVQLANVERAYQAWYQTRLEEADLYRLILIGYTVFLLLALAYLGYRLQLSYSALDRVNRELVDANRTLESKVAARTKELSGALKDLKDSQSQLIQSEKMASLGTMVAGVAHEINTPLGYARSNAEIVRSSLGSIRELCAAQGKALGLLAAANSSEQEIAGALAEAEQVRESVQPDELMGDLDNLLGDTDHGLVQIADLVSSLKDFSRVDRSRNDLFDLNAGIDSALKICQNQLKGRILVEKQYGALPEIECSPSQINQVFLNLINNAAQAIAGEGVITIATAADKDGVMVTVRDTGSGMSEAVKKRIFEPFFTTKPVGKGTGLGLSIVFRIIEEHGGRITVESREGAGTVFAVHLPLKQTKAAA